MFATTIAEYFVEDGRVSVDLEIGLADLVAFQNLLPDEIYEELVGEPIPLAERLPRFFAEDLAIAADAADPLPGRLLELAPRSRVRRDEITGEPLPAAQADPDELIVFARLEYPFAGRPASLRFQGKSVVCRCCSRRSLCNLMSQTSRLAGTRSSSPKTTYFATSPWCSGSPPAENLVIGMPTPRSTATLGSLI